MIEFNGKKFCENCFSEWTVGNFCTHCGYNPAVTAADPTMLKPGSVLLGKYIVGKVIGKGGFGVTYVAYDITTNKKVAIKEFFPYGVALRAPGTATVSVSSMDNADAFKMGAEKFYNEAKLVSKFNGNPNIVGVHEFFYENDTVYFAMEYLQGHTLKEHIQEHGVLTPAQALFIFQNVSNALMAAHSLNVMHRDISPDNIILCDNGDVKLIDFGAARQVVAEHSQSFSVILKPGFAPLEQYQKKGNQGPWTDIYSLGATIYHSLTEDIPEDPMSRIDDDEEFSSNKYNIDPELWAIIKKATELKIEDRYGDVFMLRNDLNNVSYQPEPVIVPAEGTSDKMPDIHTAVPFGMTQAVTQPAQPVTVAVGNPAPSVQPAQPVTVAVGNPAQSVQPAQPMGVSAPNQPAVPNPANSPAPAKKSHKGAIIGICGGLAAVVAAVLCVIFIPKALENNNPPISDSDRTSKSEKVSSKTPSEESEPPAVPTVDVPSDRVYYSTLSGDEKKVYELIYSAVKNHADSVSLSGTSLTKDEVEGVFEKIVCDNPQFCDTSSYIEDYDTSGSAVTKFKPTYFDADRKVLNDTVKNDVINAETSNPKKIDALCALYDKIITNTSEPGSDFDWGAGRYSAYGAIIDRYNFEISIALALCYYAQEMGFPCTVVRGAGEGSYWCKVKIDGVWYNASPYADKYYTEDSPVKSMYLDTSSVKNFHTFFLVNDEFMNYIGFHPQEGFDNLPAANSKQANYYLQKDESYSFYYKYENLDALYNEIVSWAAKRFKDGASMSSVYVAPWLVDKLWEKVKPNIIPDLINNYGIKSDIKVTCRYEPDKFFSELN